jgi:hypothetical protein
MGMQMDDKTFQSSLLETQVKDKLHLSGNILTKDLAGDADQGSYKMELRNVAGVY